MAARPALLKQSELTRYAKALRAAGVTKWRVVVRPDGTHEIIAGNTDVITVDPNPNAPVLTPLEKWRTGRAAG
jgi:hypothetical protein